MQKSKLFCKLLSIVSAGLVACSGGLVSNHVGAFSAKDIINGCISGSLYGWECSPEECDFIHSLGFESYDDFHKQVKPFLGKKFFKKNGKKLSERDDNVCFICFIKLIQGTYARFDKDRLVRRLISERTSEQRRWDKIVAKMVSKEFGSFFVRACSNAK